MKRTALSPSFLGAIALVVGILGWFGYRWLAERTERAAERASILADVAAEVGPGSPDTAELSRLMARIKSLPDHAEAPDLLTAAARIEFARGRVDRAAELFLPIARQPGAAPEQQGFAARILLRRHAGGVADRSTAVGMLEEVIAFAEAAHDESRAPDDLLLAWLAAVRLSDKERSKRLGERLVAEHPDSDAAALVGLLRSFSPQMPPGEVDAVGRRFDESVPEIEVARVLLRLQGGDLAGAAEAVEPVLLRAPGLVEVRWAAALVFHASAIGSPAGSGERERWLRRRDAQLDWLLAQAAPDDPRRSQWDRMLGQR